MRDQVVSVADPITDTLAHLEVSAVGVASLAEPGNARLADMARRLLPTAESVVVLGREIYPEVLAHTTPTKVMGEAALRDILAPHMAHLDGRLTSAIYKLCDALHAHRYRALPLPSDACPVDPRHQAAIFSFKHAAQAAGLGVMGKSALLITPQFGPRVRLACLLTEAKLASTAADHANPCLNCDACIEACPARAIAQPSGEEACSVNKFVCCAFRAGSGACSECMKVCPVGAW